MRTSTRNPAPRPAPWQVGSPLLWLALLAMTLLTVGGLLLPAIPVRTDTTRMCPTCGSSMTQTQRVLLPDPPPVIETSPLVGWMSDRGRPHTHDWRFLNRSGTNLYGGGVSIGCGRAPAIYFMGSTPPLMEAYLAASSDEEVAVLLEVMEGDDEAAQQHAVSQAEAVALQHLDSQP